jgi:hypothetical protein
VTNRTATNHVPSVSTCEMSSLHRTCSEVTSVSSATRKVRRGRSHSIVILALLSQAQVASSPSSMCGCQQSRDRQEEWRQQRGDLHDVKRLIVCQRGLLISASASFRVFQGCSHLACCLPRLCCAVLRLRSSRELQLYCTTSGSVPHVML